MHVLRLERSTEHIALGASTGLGQAATDAGDHFLKLGEGLLLAFVEGETQRHALSGEGEGAVFVLVVGVGDPPARKKRKRDENMRNRFLLLCAEKVLFPLLSLSPSLFLLFHPSYVRT